MIIQKKRINSVKKYIQRLKPDTEIQISIPINVTNAALIRRIGFPPDFKSGYTILPSPVGPVSSFNSEGSWKVLKDLPKESRYIRTVEWSWKQWAGRNRYEIMTDYCDVFKDCYQREFIDPPSEEITYVEGAQSGFFTSRTLIVNQSNYEDIKHCINLFLELFGVCHIVKKDMSLAVPPKIQKLNWKLLPQGEYPWEQLKPHIEDRIRSSADNVRSVIWDRQKTIHSFNPSMQAVGVGGFHDYIAYIFDEQGFVVLESVQKGNAIYVFGQDWEKVSRLSKAEILSQGLQMHRIVHSKGWKRRLAQIFKESENKVKVSESGAA